MLIKLFNHVVSFDECVLCTVPVRTERFKVVCGHLHNVENRRYTVALNLKTKSVQSVDECING